MKTVAFMAVVLCALIIGSMSWTSSAATNNRKQRAVTTFDKAVTLHGVVLKGTYLFVHDDVAMGRGEACTRIYKGEAETASKLVASFHCIPVQRLKVKNFTVRTEETSPGIMELREFQFSGDLEGHAVPVAANAVVVPVVN